MIDPRMRRCATIGPVGVLVALAWVVSCPEGTHALTFFEDIAIPPTPAESRPLGIEFRAKTGPTGGPYRNTEFFLGVSATEANGTWASRDNSWGICYNFDNCTSVPLVPEEHSFVWGWEATYKPTKNEPTLIENNVNVRYKDGSYHRPWAFHITTDHKRASLNFLPMPDVVKFQINANGNVAIGTRDEPGPPVRQLEVFGHARVTKDVVVDGTLTIAGLRAVTSSGSPGQGVVRWAISNGHALSSGEGVCSESGLVCAGTVLPDGTFFDCDTSLVAGTVLFALCR